MMSYLKTSRSYTSSEDVLSFRENNLLINIHSHKTSNFIWNNYYFPVLLAFGICGCRIRGYGGLTALPYFIWGTWTSLDLGIHRGWCILEPIPRGYPMDDSTWLWLVGIQVIQFIRRGKIATLIIMLTTKSHCFYMK